MRRWLHGMLCPGSLLPEALVCLCAPRSRHAVDCGVVSMCGTVLGEAQDGSRQCYVGVGDAIGGGVARHARVTH